MNYKLIVTEKAEEQMDNLVYYLLNRIKNQQAASHLLACVEKIYDRLEENPYQFLLCRDKYLASKEYREAVLPGMNYVIIFKINETEVYVLGVFHELEQYRNKM